MAGKFFHTAHPHTLTDIRLTLLTQIDIFWEKIHFNLRSVRRTAIVHPRNQIWILARTLALLPFHTGESWPSVHDPTEPRGRRRSETLLSLDVSPKCEMSHCCAVETKRTLSPPTRVVALGKELRKESSRKRGGPDY